MQTIKNTINIDNQPSSTTHKKWLLLTLAAAVLSLSACDKKAESTMEGSALEIDSQTSEAEAAAEDGAIVSEDMSSAEVGVAGTDNSAY
jgi:hypothetical protein